MSRTVNTCLSVAILVALGSRLAAAQPIDYNRDIRPLLADNCFNCHGPDEKQRKAKLRLDTREGLLRVVVAGKPSDSELARRVLADDVKLLMPPPKSGKALKPQHKDLLRRWIEQGAAWSGHWAFVPPRRPAVPEIRNPKSRNPKSNRSLRPCSPGARETPAVGPGRPGHPAAPAQPGSQWFAAHPGGG